MRVVRFIRGCRVHRGEVLGSPGALVFAGFIGVRSGGHCVHQGVLSVLPGSSGVVGFIRVRPSGGRVHPGSLGSSGCVPGAAFSSRVIGVRISDRRILLVSLGPLVYAMAVIGFIQGRWVDWVAL